ncbi:MAG TPA: hypothetical protein VLQ90_12720 [Pyrinomonadaceae bacterium]|nr:hypothetical protein [Pyrinomonadaceae bacterium]
MRKQILIVVALAAFDASESNAATIAAGTTLVVRTQHAISSADAPGTEFTAQLQSNLQAEGKTLLPAGTKLVGRVATSRRMTASSQSLTIDITAANLAGRTIAIHTTGAVRIDNNIRTRGGVSVSRAIYTVPAGKIVQFQLARPINF